MVDRSFNFHNWAFMRSVAIILSLMAFSASSSAMTPLELLSMLDEARMKNSFTGTFIHRRGDSMSSFSIVHGARDGVLHERLKSLDGSPREILRDGESVTCIHPEGEGSRWDQVPPLTPLVPADDVNWERLQAWFEYNILTYSRIAGREAVVIEVRSKFHDRFVRRYGVDLETGLLLKTEIIGPDGRSLELAQFSQIEIDPDNLDEKLQPTISGKRTVFDRNHWMERKTFADNWRPDWLPGGFTLTGKIIGDESKKYLEAYTYSDGLSSFSLFREEINDQFVEMEGRGGGATVAVSRVIKTKDGEIWGITLVGEIPVETAKRVASSVTMIN
ncbi:MucB/RseB C-terminal domain-containing protein [Litoribacillus peritrichatus]